MSVFGRIRAAIVNGIRGFGAWQAEIPDQGRVVLVGLAGLATGFLTAGQAPLALGVPGGILVVIGLGIDFRDRRTALVLVAAVALVLVAVILGGR